MFNSKRFFTAV